MLRRSILGAAAALLIGHASASAATFTFDTNPFAGSNALETPGRQIVGGEPNIVFDTATDQFVFFQEVFGVTTLNFVNDVIANVPTSGPNLVVLRTFDNDNDTTTPFGAGNAATLIATQLTSSGPGFFIYFNQGLDLPRLVFSTDLGDATADLKILARLVNNFNGDAGKLALANFAANDFAAVPAPEPTSLLLLGTGLIGLGRSAARRLRARK